jgi:serine-type D-Ala-D-Ala carboxypeptidase/endopeptidase (penicillin-binding protein 4)
MRRRSISLIGLALVLFSSCTISKQVRKSAENTIFSKSVFNNAHVGISIYDPAKKEYLYNYQGDKYFVPASNTKIATCYAAMKYLGDSLIGAEYIKDQDDYTLRFTGDPTLLHPDFKQQPVIQFIEKNADKLTIIPAPWKTERWGNGWAWNDYDAAYMAERSAAPVFGNVISFIKKNNAISVVPKYFKDSLTLLADSRKTNLYISRGLGINEFYLQEGGSKFNTSDIPFVTSEALTAVLIGEHISKSLSFVDAEVKSTQWKSIYSQHTDSMLKPMMHNSDNMFAEQSLLMAAFRKLGILNEAQLIDTILKTDFADLPQKPRWVDGSGLSRYNLFTPQDFVAILQKINQEQNWERITTVFQTGGEGTISSYYTKYAGKIFAKTGTLSGQVAFSGYLLTNKGKKLIFSVLVNNHQTSATTIRRAVESFLTGIIDKY